MPKTPIDYSKCEMYKIVCKDEELDYIYVGHTTNWTKRKNQHKNMSLTSTVKLYQTIRDNGGWDNFKMLQIESFPCNGDRDLEIMYSFFAGVFLLKLIFRGFSRFFSLENS